MSNSMNADAVALAEKIDGHLREGRKVVLSNHLKAVALNKKHVGAVTASGNGIRIYGGPLWLLGSFAAKVY